ncbi:MAG TPA: iron ABC transporter permease [Methylomirabilota bacterium]|jgi:iron(III) transport system permease protein|nr:iron ABC transporter permease [Methylomirabilota bacterium]
MRATAGLSVGGWPSLGRRGFEPWSLAAGMVATLVAAPIVLVALSLARPSVDVWRHLWETQLLALIGHTLALAAGVGLGVAVLGTGLAWLVTMYRFPGRGLFEWLLILPLAMPAYVIAFVFLALFDYAGPVQRAARAVTGGPVRGFPDIASYGGVVLVMTLVLYPYVYLLARAAFLEQSAATLEAARALGVARPTIFWRIALPLARPSIVAGVSLALMEALADFGTVAIFNYSTFTVAIYRVWFGLFNRHAATELASLLVLFTLGLYAAERALRGRARFHQRDSGVRPAPARRLTGARAAAATAGAALVVGVAFVLPVVRLLTWIPGGAAYDARYPHFLGNTLAVAALTAGVTLLAAVVVAYGLRLSRSSTVAVLARIAGMGYALPGSVIAVGVLALLAGLDRLLGRLSGGAIGLMVTGSVAGLVFAYAVRFLAVSFQTVDASLLKITPSMDMAARSLGVRPGGVLRRVHLPLLRRGLFTAALLVFVDVMKEMPATLLLRPLGYETLAVRVWQFTSESLWEAAALPALTIVAAGVLPLILLVRESARPLVGARDAA